MCGYCTEYQARLALQARPSSDGPIDSESVDLTLYLKEVRDLRGALRQLTMQTVDDPWIASIIMCRAIEMLLAHGFESEVYQGLLQQPQFTFAISFATRGAEATLGDLNTRLNASDFAWLFEKDTYLVPGCFEQHNNELSEKKSESLLNEYVDWWLEGGSVPHQDLDQRMKDTGIMDPIEDIPEAERLLLESRFPVIWFALLRSSRPPEGTKILWTIITRNPSGVPFFDGLDLWLQRRATLAVYDQQGLGPFLSEIQTVRPALIQFLVAARTTKTEEKNAFMERVAALDFYNCDYAPLDDWQWADAPQ